MKNLLETTLPGDAQFDYSVSVAEAPNCPVDPMTFISLGATDSNLPLGSGDVTVGRVNFKILSTAPLCNVRYKVIVNAVLDGQTVDTYSDSFDVTILPK
jgi:hypothetical protein